MTATLELERATAAVIPPVGATGWRLTVLETRPVTTYAVVPIIGGRRDGAPVIRGNQRDCTIAYELLTGRALRSAPRSAAERIDVPGRSSLAGDPAGPAERGAVRSVRSHERSNPSLPDVAGADARGGRTASATATASGPPGAHAGLAKQPAGPAPEPCKACGRDLSHLPTPKSKIRRQTCDDSCRQAYHRGERAPESGVVTPEAIARLSRLPGGPMNTVESEAPDPAPDVDQLALLSRGLERPLA